MDYALGSSSQSHSPGEVLKRNLVMLRRRWKTMAIVSLAVFVIGMIGVMLLPPKYEATARVQIDPARNNAPNRELGLSLGSEAIETEVTVFGAEELARDVVQRLKLQNDPEFNKGLETPALSPLEEADRLSTIARRVQKGLNVRRDRLTYVINVGYKSLKPVKSAVIANTFAEAYLDYRVGSRTGTAARQSKFFQQQLAELAAQVRAADDAVAQYRARAGIVEGTGASTIADQQVAPLSTQLASAEAEAAEARSNLAVARQQIARGGLDAVSEVRNSTVVSNLRAQRAEVSRNASEIDSRYGERHPESLKVHEQLRSLDAQIEAEARRAIGTLEATARASEARAASLRGDLSGLQGKQAANTRASVEAQSLERDAASKRAAYDKLAEMSLDTQQSARNQIAQAVIVDRAVAPTAPSAPNRKMLAITALVVALAAGLAVIIAQELLQTGVRDADFFYKRYGLPLLASVPMTPKGVSPADVVADRPTSAVAESLRIARSAIVGKRADPSRRVIAFTSALPEEGKTTTALSFARVLALNGGTTVLVDCDIRRASVSTLAQIRMTQGLVEYLRGTASFDQVVRPDRVDNLDIVGVAEPTFTSENLFGGEAFDNLLSGLAGRYDHVVLDLPPVVGLADARTVSAKADAVVLITSWSSTPASAVDSAMTGLSAESAKVIGAVFTKVDPLSEAGGGMYYSKKFAAYYQQA
ncbi:GumC family protein [Sphingomonas sp. ID0503]|uniref:GumC family protein n=1 Tax=Sphingomonas sp. ID0503 TaxID=3399691 RepID=UPI003AFA8B4F